MTSNAKLEKQIGQYFAGLVEGYAASTHKGLHAAEDEVMRSTLKIIAEVRQTRSQGKFERLRACFRRS